MTLTLSVEAVQPMVIELVVAPVAVRLPGIVGACVSGAGGDSGQALVGELTVAWLERFPAPS